MHICTHAHVDTYTAQTVQGKVRPIVPHLSDALYESAYESQLWQLYDSRKKRLSVGDAYPSHYSTTLAKGDYTLQLQVCVGVRAFLCVRMHVVVYMSGL